MSEWIKSILGPLIKEAVNEAVSESVNKSENDYYKGIAYGEARERLKKDQEYEQELYRMFKEGVKQGEERKALELGAIEEITAEEFDRLASQPPESTTKTEIPDGFGFVGTMDDISLVLDEEVTA